MSMANHSKKNRAEDKKENKIIFKQVGQMRKDFGLTEYSSHCDVKDIQKHFKDNIDSFTAQKIALTLWKTKCSEVQERKCVDFEEFCCLSVSGF